MSVFITDANYKHTLAIVRSFGSKHKILVDVGSAIRRPVCMYSKYVNKTYRYPLDELGFVSFLQGYVVGKYDVVIPVSYDLTKILSKYKRIFEKTITKVPVIEYSRFRIAANKLETLKAADDIGIPIPRTLHINAEHLDFPMVVKGSLDSGTTRYVHSKAEISTIDLSHQVVQEYVGGEGYGFFALYNHGKARAIFMHKRIREYPVSGGPSTCAESIYDEKLKDLGMKLLNLLNWHGVAMVEFKRTKDGEYKLMEINPKFWGSLDLAIASGVDFPYLLYKMCIDGDVRQNFSYKVGVRFMWVTDDLVRTLSSPMSLKDFITDLLSSRVEKDLQKDDIKPFSIQIWKTAITMVKRL
jgi:predicted ATP-grasp superfamily ATP-dependent carboligase